MVTNMTLVKIASIGGIITVTTGMMLRSRVQDNIRNTEYYKEALKTVRGSPQAIYLLGEPIKDRPVNFDDRELNFTGTYSARYEVPVTGPKQKGTVYFWAKKTDNQWSVNRIELGIDNEPDRRLLIKNVN